MWNTRTIMRSDSEGYEVVLTRILLERIELLTITRQVCV